MKNLFQILVLILVALLLAWASKPKILEEKEVDSPHPLISVVPEFTPSPVMSEKITARKKLPRKKLCDSDDTGWSIEYDPAWSREDPWNEKTPHGVE